MRTRLLVGLSLTLVTALVVTWSFSRSPEPDTVAPLSRRFEGLRWRAGNAQRYSVWLDSAVRISNGGVEPPAPLVQTARGELEFRTLEAGPDEVTVGMRLFPIDLSIAGVSDSESNRVLASPFRVRFDAEGILLAFEFPGQLSAEHRALIEEIVRTFATSVRSESSWIVEETHATGSYVAKYQRDGEEQLRKTKLDYKSPGPAAPRVQVVHSEASIRLDPTIDWIAGMVVDETLTMEPQAGVVVTVKTRAKIEILPDSDLLAAVGVSTPWEFPASAPPAQLGLDTRNKARGDRSIEQLSQDLRADLAALDGSGEGRSVLVHRLRDLLLMEEELATLLLNEMNVQELQDRTRADLFLVFELAGTAKAQEALCRVVSEPKWSQKDGTRALVAMGGLEKPTPETIDVLWQTSKNRSSTLAADYANTAALSIGSLGSRMLGEDSAGYSALRQQLTSASWAARDARERSILVMALGNTGDPTLSRELVSFLEDDDSGVRQSVARALIKLGVEEVADDLLLRLEHEPSGKVRATLAGALATWKEPSSEAMMSMRGALPSERDDSTRFHMAQFLGRNLAQFPENRAALENLLRSEDSDHIRRYLGEVLANQ